MSLVISHLQTIANFSTSSDAALPLMHFEKSQLYLIFFSHFCAEASV